ncbi:hypothetical protein FQN55_009016 [Onygenales sp. PD_40]|nr:hypothetical protein FQN55_009016 [Onygenales sp. PD_40]
MLIKGEKWACEACIRGHRVSNCQHADRPLSHINKKGRPVSQCPHCRGLRKARTTHTKCECGEKPHTKVDCPAEPGDTQAGKKKPCCCSHGSRCTCAAKRDSNLATVPEAGTPPRSRAATHLGHRRPHLSTAKSEDPLPGFPSRHHRNRPHEAANRCLPYSIPRSNTVHISSGLARHSADHLPLPEPGLEMQGMPGLDSITSAPLPVRRVRSEHGSPANLPSLGIEDVNSQIPPLDISSATYNGTTTPAGLFDYTEPNLEQFCSPETETFPETPSFNVSHVDWSTFGMDSVPTTFSQPPSYASFDHANFNHPGLAASSSGELSEVEDFGLAAGVGISNLDHVDTHSISDGSEKDLFRISSSSSYIDLQQAQMLASNDIQSVDITSFLKAGNAMTRPPQHFDVPASTAIDTYSVSQSFPLMDAGSFAPIDDDTLLVAHGGFVIPEPNNFMWGPTSYPVATSAHEGNIPQHTQWF